VVDRDLSKPNGARNESRTATRWGRAGVPRAAPRVARLHPRSRSRRSPRLAVRQALRRARPGGLARFLSQPTERGGGGVHLLASRRGAARPGAGGGEGQVPEPVVTLGTT